MRIICFLFIGDGMSYPQFQAASDYLGAIADEDYVKALPSNSYEDRGGAVLDGPEAGYKVTYTQADAEAVTAEGGKIDWACHAGNQTESVFLFCKGKCSFHCDSISIVFVFRLSVSCGIFLWPSQRRP